MVRAMVVMVTVMIVVMVRTDVRIRNLQASSLSLLLRPHAPVVLPLSLALTFLLLCDSLLQLTLLRTRRPAPVRADAPTARVAPIS